MPQVAVDSISAQPLDGGLTQVTAVIVNRKLTPTRAAVDVKNKISPSDRIRISGDNLKVIAGLSSGHPRFDKPLEQKRKPEELRIPTIGGMKAVYVRWIVAGAGPYQVTIRSAKGGVATLSGPALAAKP